MGPGKPPISPLWTGLIETIEKDAWEPTVGPAYCPMKYDYHPADKLVRLLRRRKDTFAPAVNLFASAVSALRGRAPPLPRRFRRLWETRETNTSRTSTLSSHHHHHLHYHGCCCCCCCCCWPNSLSSVVRSSLNFHDSRSLTSRAREATPSGI